MAPDNDQRTASVFSPWLLASGIGALWCADYRYPVLVRVDEDTRQAVIWASFADGNESAGGVDGPADLLPEPGPRDIAAGLGAIWVLSADGARLLQVDPGTGTVIAYELAIRLASICTGAGAVFGIGGPGVDHIARITPDGNVTVRRAGQSLRLIAADGNFAWTVDDATATVFALDSQSLEPVRTFRHVGAPDALCARGSQAWYVATAEREFRDQGGRQQRAVQANSDGFRLDVLRLDAAAGSSEPVRVLAGVAPRVVLDGGRLWISGAGRDGPAEDPMTPLRCLSISGDEILSVELPGQIDALAAGERGLWVSGFRASRQAQVVTLLGPGGAVTGEVSFAGLDLSPWTPPPPAPLPQLPWPQRARAVRDAVEAGLTGPVRVHGRFGDTWEEPAVSPEFRLDRVEVEGSGADYWIAVLFRWAGEDDLFGLRYRIPGYDEGYEAPDAYITVYVEEQLIAQGLGLARAVREPAGGVTWLRWPPGPPTEPRPE